MSQLPIQAVMPELLDAVACSGQVILKAAPGAGKSTCFPLHLLQADSVSGKIIMLQPRRLAARNIARYLAQQLGEPVGQQVGYRVRGDSKVSAATRLEVVTEGILTRMLQADPELSGVAMLIFDEFHERSLHADTALALSLEVQEALRDDLKLVVMSATLDQQALQQLLPDARYIESHGRSFPVEVRYQSPAQQDSLERHCVRVIHQLLASESGSMLVFLPGAGAIHRVAQALDELAGEVQVYPLYGQLSFADQQRAIAPAAPGERKVVLATNLAETSLTIEGIRLVVDSGYERVARFEPKTGLTKLQQVRIARSSAEQRTGRAGRLEAGICVRLYSESQYRQQPEVPAAEILHSDLAPLALELAFWGCQQPDELRWLDLPPKPTLNQGQQLLQQLQLLDDKLALTGWGRQAHQLALEPRLAAMLLLCAQLGSKLVNTAIAAACLMEEPEKQVSDLSHSLHHWQSGRHSKRANLNNRAKQLAGKLKIGFDLQQAEPAKLATVLSLAYPDRVAQRRSQQGHQYRLATGHGGELDRDDPLNHAEYLVALDLVRSGQSSSRINLAVALEIEPLQQSCPQLFEVQEWVDWDDKRGSLIAERRTCLGQLLIAAQPLPAPGAEKMTQALLNFVRRQGLGALNWSDSASELLTRIRCGSEWLPEHDWPAMDEASLLAELDDWLAPYMTGVKNLKQLQGIDLVQALNARLGWPLNQQIDSWLPKEYPLPTGRGARIRYQQGADPVLSVRMQEVFGEKQSPVIAEGRKNIVLELLSPAQRPLQITSDLAGFWRGAYLQVQKEMKGRYPKHVWPDDPANHIATSKTKRQLKS
ncbi:ATP-dependent helicase HrpB [Vibrio sp.]|uniref:ATP-dependent helicase HrpB n=1 Tax=Vibrio sp. TaxID=678 RepID=UPI003D0FB74E